MLNKLLENKKYLSSGITYYNKHFLNMISLRSFDLKLKIFDCEYYEIEEFINYNKMKLPSRFIKSDHFYEDY